MPSDEARPDLAIMQLPDFFKTFIRRYADSLGLHRLCGFKACQRAGGCATRDVMCYQILREQMNPHLRKVVRARLEQEGILPPSGGA